MTIHRRCVKRGHKWDEDEMMPLIQFCRRFRCTGERVNPEYPMPLFLKDAVELVLLERIAEREKR